ncbi:MAG: glycosyltransferase family 4 protein [Clostridia bacterium]|nr:glycosyltransferase family 4 protein [Clostridia bacterium]
MKILILRTMANVLRLNTYNLQEVGLAKALTRLGHQCDVAYYTDEKKDRRETIVFDGDRTITILWMHGYNFLYEAIYPSLKSYIADYDIIQVTDYVGFNSVWLNARHQEKTVNYQGPYYSPYNKKDNLRAFVMDRLLLPFSHPSKMLVGTKSTLATRYLQEKRIPNVTTLGVGIDLDNLTRTNDQEPPSFIREVKAKKQSFKYLLYIGRLEPRRNILFLLDVYRKALERDNNIRLILIGKGDDDYTAACREKAAALQLQDKIIYHPQLDQKYVKEIYQCCDLFLLPTRYEIFGMVLLEAMYFGMPVLTTFNGGSSTLIQDGQNGFILNEMDENQWAEKICSILQDPLLTARVASRASESVAQHYTWDALAPRFVELYNRRLRKADQ